VLTVPIGATTFADTLITSGAHSYTVAALDGAGNASAQSSPANANAAPGGGATAPVYDDNGNMTSDGSYGNRQYAYDTLGRLASVTGSDGSLTTYALDGFGNRWSQTTGTTTTSFDLDLQAGNPTLLFDGVRKYLPGAPGAGFESGGTWKTALTDLIGSPIELIDTAGAVSGLTHYDPYGVPRPGSTASVGIGYAGEYRDGTGLINLRARSYDPVLGRFIGRDTFAGVASAPQTGNRYAYATANPLRFTDPSGRFVNAALAVLPTLAEMAITFNPVGAAIVFGYQVITGTDLATGEAINRDLALDALALTLLPPVVGLLSKALTGLGRDAAIGIQDAGMAGARASEEAAALSNAEREIAAVTRSASGEVRTSAAATGAGALHVETEAAVAGRFGSEARAAEHVGSDAGAITAEGASGGGTTVGSALRTYYPPNRGFFGTAIKQTLKPGTRIDRFGHEGGTFVSPVGTPLPMRALPPGAGARPYSVYEVVKPIEVNAGRSAPWFDQIGLGTQFELPESVADLIEQGFLKAVGR
jgi:RHS repeat-associated protein